MKTFLTNVFFLIPPLGSNFIFRKIAKFPLQGVPLKIPTTVMVDCRESVLDKILTPKLGNQLAS